MELPHRKVALSKAGVKNAKKKLRQPVKIVSEKERLALSLAGCCPEVCYNELLLRKLRGKEKKTVETIEEMIDGNAPFDEIKGKITSFLKPIADLTGDSNESGMYEEAVTQNLSIKSPTDSNLVKLKVSPRREAPPIYMAGQNDLTLQFL